MMNSPSNTLLFHIMTPYELVFNTVDADEYNRTYIFKLSENKTLLKNRSIFFNLQHVIYEEIIQYLKEHPPIADEPQIYPPETMEMINCGLQMDLINHIGQYIGQCEFEYQIIENIEQIQFKIYLSHQILSKDDVTEMLQIITNQSQEEIQRFNQQAIEMIEKEHTLFMENFTENGQLNMQLVLQYAQQNPILGHNIENDKITKSHKKAILSILGIEYRIDPQKNEIILRRLTDTERQCVYTLSMPLEKFL